MESGCSGKLAPASTRRCVFPLMSPAGLFSSCQQKKTWETWSQWQHSQPGVRRSFWDRFLGFLVFLLPSKLVDSQTKHLSEAKYKQSPGYCDPHSGIPHRHHTFKSTSLFIRMLFTTPVKKKQKKNLVVRLITVVISRVALVTRASRYHRERTSSPRDGEIWSEPAAPHSIMSDNGKAHI